MQSWRIICCGPLALYPHSLPRQIVSALELQMNLREENLIKEKKGLLLVKSTYILVLSHLRHYAKQALTYGK